MSHISTRESRFVIYTPNLTHTLTSPGPASSRTFLLPFPHTHLPRVQDFAAKSLIKKLERTLCSRGYFARAVLYDVPPVPSLAHSLQAGTCVVKLNHFFFNCEVKIAFIIAQKEIM